MLSDQQITKFQELYFSHFGIQLDKNEAYEKASKVLRLVELVYEPITKEKIRALKAALEKSGDLHTK